jgi:hypothetical protein
MLIKNISASRLETFAMCIFKYFLTYHDKVKLKSNWGASHGTLLHDILEKYANGTDHDWMRRLYEGYAGQLKTDDKFGEKITLESPLIWAKPADFAEQKPHCDTCPFRDSINGVCKISQEPLDKLKGCPKKLFENSIRILEGVFRRYNEIYNNKESILGTEYRIEFNLTQADGTLMPLVCILDLVRKINDDTVEIIDYKFGNKTKTYDELMVDTQALICSYASRKEFIEDINKKGHKFKNVMLTFDYFMASPITVAFTEKDDLTTEKRILQKALKIQETKKVTRVIGSGDFDWKCKAMCDVAVCKAKWKGNFNVE